MVSIRRLSASDVAGFRTMNAIFSDVFDEPENYSDAKPSDDNARDWLSDPKNVAILAEDDGRPAGALAGFLLPKFEQARSELYIYDLAVHEEFRRQGIATKMIEETRRIAREAGAWTIFVQADVQPEDEPAQALYRKLASNEISVLHFDIKP